MGLDGPKLPVKSLFFRGHDIQDFCGGKRNFVKSQNASQTEIAKLKMAPGDHEL